MRNFILIIAVISLFSCKKDNTNEMDCKNAISGYLKYYPQSGSCMDWYIVTSNGWLMPANLEQMIPNPSEGKSILFSFEYAAQPMMNFQCEIAPLVTITCIEKECRGVEFCDDSKPE